MNIKGSLLTLLIAVCILFAGIAVYIWLGWYNVGATVPHWKVTHWFLEQVRERSIIAHSREIIIPSLEGSKLFDIGFENYHAMCQLCHGAPGYSRTEIAKGLYPSSPELASQDVVKSLNNAELHWVIKNGIKMTGMPAFGATHSEDELWAMVAFVKRLPNLKPKEYNAMVKAAGLKREREDDHHGHKLH